MANIAIKKGQYPRKILNNLCLKNIFALSSVRFLLNVVYAMIKPEITKNISTPAKPHVEICCIQTSVSPIAS